MTRGVCAATSSAPSEAAPARSGAGGVAALFTVPSRGLLSIACLVQFMVVLDVTIVSVALPSTGAALDLDIAGQQWVVNAYTLTLGGFLLVGGRAGDVFGRRRTLCTGLAVFSAASLAGGLAEGGTMLIAARAIQGLGAAIIAPAALSLITTTFTDDRARARALTWWSVTAASGGAFGTAAGGLLTDLLSWRWVMFVNVPIGIGLLMAAFMHIPSAGGRSERTALDLPGAVTVTAGVGFLVYAIVTTRERGWGSAGTLGLLACALALIGAFVLIEQRSRQPMMPLATLRNRTLAGANLISWLLGGVIVSQVVLISLFLQQVNGESPLRAGMLLLPISAVALPAAFLAGRLVRSVGSRMILIVGPLFGAAGLLWLGQLGEGDPYLALLVPGLVSTAGIACCFVPVTIAGTRGVAPRDQGLISGLLQSFRQVGAAVCLAALVTVAASQSTALVGEGLGRAAALAGGYDRAFLVAAGLSMMMSLTALLLLPSDRPVPRGRDFSPA